jgi:hypothetical protein
MARIRDERVRRSLFLVLRTVIDVGRLDQDRIVHGLVASAIIGVDPDCGGIRSRGDHGETAQGSALRRDADYIFQRRPILRGCSILVGEYQLLIRRNFHVIALSDSPDHAFIAWLLSISTIYARYFVDTVRILRNYHTVPWRPSSLIMSETREGGGRKPSQGGKSPLWKTGVSTWVGRTTLKSAGSADCLHPKSAVQPPNGE